MPLGSNPGYVTHLTSSNVLMLATLGVILCLERALATSGVAREDVNYVNAHATSTLAGDMAEYRAITKCVSFFALP